MKILITLLLTMATYSADFEIKGPFIREVPPVSKMSAGFMEVINNTGKDQKIVRANSSIAKVVELHNHELIDGVMKMRKVDFIKLPAKSKAVLKPKSYHIMFIGLTRELKEGQNHKISIELDNGTTLEASAPVKKVKMMEMKTKDESHESGESCH
jgi:copper(I)-binding protein